MLNRVSANEIIKDGQGEKARTHGSICSEDNSFRMICLPVGEATITIGTTNLPQKITAWWFNPKDGHAQKINDVKKENTMNLRRRRWDRRMIGCLLLMMQQKF